MSNVLECREVVKTFRDGSRELRILRGVDLEVREGESLAISGPSGAGKSTLLHILGTLDRPTRGEVLFRGESFAKMSRNNVNRIRNQEIGFVFQFYHLLPEFTAIENVMMPALCKGGPRRTWREHATHVLFPFLYWSYLERVHEMRRAWRDRAAELLEKAGLADRMTHKPGKLSGGEQQRVAIARALFNKPTIVLGDEPTGNLDERTGEGIIDLLLQLNATERVTLVLVTHDDALARRAHRCVHLHEGKAYPRNPDEAVPAFD